MKSYEAMALMIGKFAEQIARRLHLSKFLIIKWKEPAEDPTDSGSLNPIDRLEFAIESAIALGIPKNDAYAPIRYLEQRFGIIGIEMGDTPLCAEELAKELMKAIKDFGKLMDTAGKALADGKIDRLEYNRIESAAWALIRQVTEFVYKSKAAVAK